LVFDDFIYTIVGGTFEKMIFDGISAQPILFKRFVKNKIIEF